MFLRIQSLGYSWKMVIMVQNYLKFHDLPFILNINKKLLTAAFSLIWSNLS